VTAALDWALLLDKSEASAPTYADGDLNEDGFVGSADLDKRITGFGASGGAILGQGEANGDANVDGADFYAVTTTSGGYSIPVDGNGTYALTCTGPNLTPSEINATVTDNRNVKVDFVPPYTPPTLARPTAAALDRPNQPPLLGKCER